MNQLPPCCTIVDQVYAERHYYSLNHSSPCSCGLNLPIGIFVNNMWISEQGTPFAGSPDDQCNVCRSDHENEENAALCQTIRNILVPNFVNQ